MRFEFLTVDVFTDRRFGGNPLAVFPNATGIPDEALQRIANEFNLSETTFVYPPSDARNTRRVRIFTPAKELPFAGHPTVGTAHALAVAGEIPLRGTETRVIFEEVVGPVPVLIRSENGKPTFCQLSVAKLPELGPPSPDPTQLAEVLSLRPTDLANGKYGAESYSCGVPFHFVPLRNRDAVRRARVRLEAWEQVLGAHWAKDIMVFSSDPERADSQLRARAFVPSVGVTEDPATGVACAALGGYLAAREPAADGTFRYVVEQGFEMGRPSILELEVDKRGGSPSAVRVGGQSVMVMQGTMEI